MYRVSGRQLILLSLLPAIISGVIVTFVHRGLEQREPSAASTEPTAAVDSIVDPTVANEEQNNIEVYRAVSPSVVYITNRSYEETWFGVYPREGSGSGSIIDQDGHILTNYHVVQGASELEVQVEAEKYPAQIVGTDFNNDLAIIKVQAPRDKLRPIRLGDSTALQVGQKVLAIGNPFGLEKTLTTGVISGLERPLRDPQRRRTIEGAIQTDASINPGNSGGPLLNSRGELIGINTMIYSPSGGSVGIGFAVPVSTARRLIPELLAQESRPWLGISTFPLNTSLARRLRLPIESGLIVGEVHRGSGAAEAGLRPSVLVETWNGVGIQQLGDVILSIDGDAVKEGRDLQRVLKDKKRGQTVRVEVFRRGSNLTIPITLGGQPQQFR